MDTVKIYLAGSIHKGDAEREKWQNWRQDYEQAIMSALPGARFLDPDLIRDSVGSELVVGHDLWQIKRSDIVIVNIPEKVGAGTSQEMVLAKYFGKPTITILPKDTHHRRSNIHFDGILIEDWIHPFVDVASDFVAIDIQQAIEWLVGYLEKTTSYQIKDISVYDQVIDSFEKDLPEIVDEYQKRGW